MPCVGIAASEVCFFQSCTDELKRIIYMHDEETLTDACWALSYLTDGSNDKIQVCSFEALSRRFQVS